MANRTRAAFFSLLLSCSPILAAQSTDAEDPVIVAHRSRAGGGASLLLQIRDVLKDPVSEVRIRPNRSLDVLTPGYLPPGWTLEKAGREWRAQGQSLSTPLFIRFDQVDSRRPARAQIRLLNGPREVWSEDVDISLYPPVQVSNSLQGVVVLPPVASPGQLIRAASLSPARTPKEGSWTFNGSIAEVEEAPGQDLLFLTVTLPENLASRSSSAVRSDAATRAAHEEPLHIQYTDPWGEVIVDVENPAEIRTVAAPPTEAPEGIQACPDRVFAGRMLCVCGSFSNPAETRIAIDGEREANVLSASPQSLLIEVPSDLSAGEHSLEMQDQGTASQKSRCLFETLRVASSIDSARLLRGESTELRLKIEGTEAPVTIRLRNRTPTIVRLEGGAEQVLQSSGGADNFLSRAVQGLSPGSFDIQYELAEGLCPCDGAMGETTRRDDSSESPPGEEATPSDSSPPGGIEIAGPGPDGEESSPPGGRRYRDCTPAEAAEQPASGPIDEFLTDPEEAAERQRIREELTEREKVLEYWKNSVCNRLEEDRKRAEENEERLRLLDERLQELARELGADLPSSCEQEECCQGASCCEGLAPDEASDRETFRKRLDCLIDRFRATNRRLQETGSDFSWLHDRWEDGAEHRAMMGFYDDLFSGFQDVIGALTTSLGDRVQELILSELTGTQCRRMGLSGALCNQIRATIEAAQNAKGAIDEVQGMVRQGTLSPAFIVSMVDKMAEAAGNAARSGVEGWQRFKEEMNATLVQYYGHLRCLIETNRALERAGADCPRFCSSAIDALISELNQESWRLDQLDAVSKASAEARMTELQERLIDPHFDAATSTKDREWIGECCSRAGSTTVKIPGDTRCARILEQRLKERLGPLYCYLREIEITIECSGRSRLGSVSYTYLIDPEPRPGCCLREVDED